MVQGLEFDLKHLVLSNTSFGPEEIRQLLGAINEDFTQFGVLRDAVGELEVREERTPATAVRLGVCYFLLGHYRSAIDTLSNADGGALARFYMGKAQFAEQQYQQAIESYTASKTAGYDSDQCWLAISEAQRCAGNLQEALNTLDNLSGAVEQTAEYLYQRGIAVASLGGNPEEVVALFQRAVDADDSHVGALFGLAMENDRRGNDSVARQLYEMSTSRFPTHVGSLLNLGVLYEDQRKYDRAQMCYQRILDIYPNEPRASLFFKDAMASSNMYYDEEAQKNRERLTQVLSTPVTDFELSVRSRNCLQKMGINTLGDLTRRTEQELLTSKNFGETSLIEIREMLTSKGLELGQFAFEQPESEPAVDVSNLSPDEQAMLERPIADLNLSVRARKCMVRLGLNTIGELLRRTANDLLECKNFGVTSLLEIREKMTEQGLRLRGE